MERNVFVVVLILFTLSGAFALDSETLIGFLGDGQARASYFGDIETAFEGMVSNVPVISWSRINAPLYDNIEPSAEAYYYDADSDVGTVYFEWFVNSVSVENDSVGGILSGTRVKAYLNSSVSVGDSVNLTVYANDGTDDSSLSYLQHVILGVGGEAAAVPYTINTIWGLACDDTYCYGGHSSGYFTKTYKNGTIAIGTSGTESGVVRPYTTNINDLYCDDTYCYGGHLSGYFTKTFKNGTIAIGTSGTESEVVQPDTNTILGISCDDTYCYGAHANGFFTKTYKNGTIAIGMGGTESGVLRPYTTAMRDITCDATYCYGAHDSGYFTKIYKNGTIVLGTGGIEGGVRGPDANTMWGISCDDTYCYGGHNNGYFTKIYKNGTIAIGTGGTESGVIRPYITAIRDITCDDTYCYGSHANGYFTKTYKNGTIVIGTGGTESEVVSASTLDMYDISCDDTYCYGGHSSGYFTKTLKSLNITVLASPVAPMINWSRINAPLYDSAIPSAEAYYYNTDSNSGTVYFEWFVNSISVENDSVSSVPSGTRVKVYLNSSVSVGDRVNLTVYANDGVEDSNLSYLQHVILGIDGEAAPVPYTTDMSEVFCDDTYCYGSHANGYFTKTYKNGTVAIGDGGTESEEVRPYAGEMMSIFCDDTYCYGSHAGGYFTKTYKNGTIAIGASGTESEVVRPYTTDMNGIFCDDTYCYGAHPGGYFTKTYKNGTIAIGTGGTERAAVAPDTANMNDITCDDTFCYGAHDGGFFTKIYKDGIIALGLGGSQGGVRSPDTNNMQAITCDTTYCYGAHDDGYLTKINKNGAIALGTSGGEGPRVRPDLSWMRDITCDDTYCYTAHANGYFAKTYKNGTIVIGDSGTDRESLRPDTNWMTGVFCDDTYCYGSHEAGVFTKTLKSLNITVMAVINELPTVTLTSPNDWNASTDRSPEFTWTGYDANSDTLTYEISIGEHMYSGVKICNDDISDDTLTLESYTPSNDLLCLYDNGYYYNWSVRAHDGTGWGNWSSVWHFNVTAEVSINLALSEVSFGSMNPGDSLNTAGGIPGLYPFEIDNDGNVVTNISLNSSAIWDEAPNESSYYQFKADNTTAELGAFNWLISIVDWFDMPITGEVVAIGELNYVDGDDSAEVDIRLEVPANEAPGVKNATIVFTGALAE